MNRQLISAGRLHYLAAYLPCYYPNSVHSRGTAGILMVEEHGNRLVRLTAQGQMADVVLAAPYPLYLDPLSTPDLMQAGEAALTGTQPDMAPGLGLAATEYAGGRTLYSPNDLRVTGHLLVIADTDNHRLVGIDRSGQIAFQVNHLFNPTGIEIPEG